MDESMDMGARGVLGIRKLHRYHSKSHTCPILRNKALMNTKYGRKVFL